jgi:Flp pilus assembly protein TadD
MPTENKDDLKAAIVALRMLVINGDEIGAYEHIEQIQTLFPPSSSLLKAIGDAFQDLGEADHANKYYRSAFNLAAAGNKRDILAKIKETEESKVGDIELTPTTSWGASR